MNNTYCPKCHRPFFNDWKTTAAPLLCECPKETFQMPQEPPLTKREGFAAMAMQGLIAEAGDLGLRFEEIAHDSVSAADALLAELSKSNPPGE